MNKVLTTLKQHTWLRAAFVLISVFVVLMSILTPIAKVYAAPTTTTSTQTTQTQQQTSNTSQQSNQQTQQLEAQSCDDVAGTLGFFLCPVYNMMTTFIDKMAGSEDSLLTKLLQVPPLQFTQDEGLARAFQNVLNFTNSLFILVFLVIIIASLVHDFSFLDSYNIKSVLPRLIAAVILAQFGFLICALAIDAGNILGVLLPKTIVSGVLGPNIAVPSLGDGVLGILTIGGSTSIIFFKAFGGTVVFLLLLVLAILAAFAVLVALIYMILRYLVLVLLVFAAPLAFLAFVLPGTQPFFFRWGKTLLKLVLMFPLVVIVITTAEVISFMLLHPTFDPNVYTTDVAKLIIGALMPFAALLLIPKCLKLSGDITGMAVGAIGGYAAGKSKAGAVKTKEDVQNRVATSETLGDTRFGRMIVAGPGGINKRNATATAKVANTRDRSQALYDKVAKNSKDAELIRMVNQKYRPAKIAGITALAENGNRMAVQDALASGKIDKSILETATQRNGDAFKGMPDLKSNWDFDNNRVDETKFFGGINAKTFGGAGGSSQQEWVLSGTRGADGRMTYTGYDMAKISRIRADQWRSILRSSDVREGLHEQVRAQLNQYATDHAHTDVAQAIRDNMNADGSWRT